MPEFEKTLKIQRKKYRHADDDLREFLGTIKTDYFPGDRLTEVDYVIYKAQAKNTDLKKGKSGSYRIVYHYAEPDLILLIVIYCKSDQTDVNKQQINYLVRQYYQTT